MLEGLSCTETVTRVDSLANVVHYVHGSQSTLRDVKPEGLQCFFFKGHYSEDQQLPSMVQNNILMSINTLYS